MGSSYLQLRKQLAASCGWLSVSGLLGLMLVVGERRRKMRLRILNLVALLTLLWLSLTLPSCGGGNNNSASSSGTPAGTYTLTVTGSFSAGSSTLSHTEKLTLVVQ